MWKVLLLVIGFLILVIIGLGINIFFTKKKKFPQTSISKNKNMRKLSITCVKHDEYKACGLNVGCCGGANLHNHDDETE